MCFKVYPQYCVYILFVTVRIFMISKQQSLNRCVKTTKKVTVVVKLVALFGEAVLPHFCPI